MEAHRTKTHAGREGNGTLEGLRDVATPFRAVESQDGLRLRRPNVSDNSFSADKRRGLRSGLKGYTSALVIHLRRLAFRNPEYQPH